MTTETPDVQAAIDAALESVACDLGGLYGHRDSHELYNQAIDDCAQVIRESIGTNPLAERDARIAELGKHSALALSDADIMKANWHAACNDIDNLTTQLAEAQARIAELESQITAMLGPDGHDGFIAIPIKAFEAYKSWGTQIADLTAQLEAAREDAERYRYLRSGEMQR